MVVLPKDLLQFQIIVNPHTGRRIGRIYFPYLYISRHKEAVKSWLEQKKIYFTPEDVKLYRDGSFRREHPNFAKIKAEQLFAINTRE